MNLPRNKTKIVATIGPASESPEVLEQLILAGMNVARLNFSHGDFTHHGEIVERIRKAAASLSRRVAVMADLPGPKMRLGKVEGGPIELQVGDPFVLTSDEVVGDRTKASMTFERLPQVVRQGDRLYLNDGLVQLLVDHVEGNDVHCKVAVGGPINSRKGLNLPRIPLGISAFTEHDRECLKYALSIGVDAISQSFVESAADIGAVRAAAAELGKKPFVIAKIERFEAIGNFDEILEAADGVMVARGDLGVEVPIQEMAVIQKRLIAKANLMCKPVITATQMLESMTVSRLPTRAEATDVANAILDGTDCVMLSEESAMGHYPVDAVNMLCEIAEEVEKYREDKNLHSRLEIPETDRPVPNPKAMLVEHAIKITRCDAVLVPSRRGNTARAVARPRPGVWTLAAGADLAVMQTLAFSYGVHSVDLPVEPPSWNTYARNLVAEIGLPCEQVLMVAGPSSIRPDDNHRLELIVI